MERSNDLNTEHSPVEVLNSDDTPDLWKEGVRG
jgi:hypothetical protein